MENEQNKTELNKLESLIKKRKPFNEISKQFNRCLEEYGPSNYDLIRCVNDYKILQGYSFPLQE